jgi:hypothetical protein
MPEYDAVRAAFQAGLTDDIFGVPEATTDAVLKLIDSENPPLRLFLGKHALTLGLNKLMKAVLLNGIAGTRYLRAHGK